MDHWAVIQFLAILLFVMGLCLGSFFNVVIGRWPHGQSVVSPPSHCPRCQHEIRWFHNVPVLGWIILKGRCYDCKLPISIQYPIVEFLTGFLAALPCLWLYLDPNFGLQEVLRLSLLLVCALPIVIIDWRYYLIPDLIVWPGAGVAFALTFISGSLDWLTALLGAILVPLGLWLVIWILTRLLKKEAMGLGDVQLMVFLGALVGINHALLILPLAACAGLLGVLVQKVFPRSPDHQEGLDVPRGSIPFGPYLCLAALIVLIWGEELIRGYFNFMGLP